MNDLTILLKVRDTLNEKCFYIPTPSSSITKNGIEEVMNYDAGYNDGLSDSMNVVMSMIEKIANFVSVCCGAKGIPKSELIEKLKDGEHHRCFTMCSKCKKECKQEWRKK